MSDDIYPAYPTYRGLAFTVMRASEYDTVIKSSSSQLESRLAQMDNPIWRWELTYNYLKDMPTDLPAGFLFTDFRKLLGFILAHQGQFDDFLFNDPDDNYYGPAMIDGSPNLDAQLDLVQDYDSSLWYSPIQRTMGSAYFEDIAELNGSLVIYDAGVLQTEGIDYVIRGPGFTFDTYNYPDNIIHMRAGIYIEWATKPTEPITAEYAYYWRVRFESDRHDLDKFMNQLWAIGGDLAQKGSGSIKLISARKHVPPTEVYYTGVGEGGGDDGGDGGGDGGGGGGGDEYFTISGAPETMFQAPSTWDTLIPESPSLIEHSADYITWLTEQGNAYVECLAWSVPVYVAGAGVQVQTQYEYDETEEDLPLTGNLEVATGYAATIAAGDHAVTVHDEYRDGHIVFIYTVDNKSREFRGYRHWVMIDPPNSPEDPNKRRQYARYGLFDLSGDGIMQPAGSGPFMRAAPVSLLSGLITLHDYEAGVISHALAMGVSSVKKDSAGVYPCVGPYSGDSEDEYALWLGHRIQLDPSVDVDSLALSTFGKMVAKALQDYGAIVVDNTGDRGTCFYAESFSDGSDTEYGHWAGIITNSNKILSGLPLSSCRVVEPVYP